MNKIYADSEEKWVKTVVLYGHTDKYLYEDADHTTKVDKDTAMNLCLKGVKIMYSDAYYMPVFFKEESGYVAVTIATTIASSTSASVVLYSEEYTEE